MVGKRTLRSGLVAGAVAFAALTGAAIAQDAPEAVIKYRQSEMKAMAGHMGAIGAIAKGEVSFTADLASHARAINDISKSLAEVFPEGTGPLDGDTAALPEIWEKPDDFAAAIKALADESAKLIEVADGGDAAAIGTQVGALGKNACGACHGTFRKKN